MSNVCGIYKITSPLGRIYIGQSRNIFKRWNIYKKYPDKNQSRLYRSLIKHGHQNHVFEIIHECDEAKLDEMEIHFIDKYKTFNTDTGLNLRGGGNGHAMADETKKKISNSRKGKYSGKNHPLYGTHRSLGTKTKAVATRMNNGSYKISEETKRRMSESHMGKTGGRHSDETKRKISIAATGRPSPLKGLPLSEETKRKLSLAHTGKKLSEEHKINIGLAGLGRKCPPRSLELRKKLSEAMRGRSVWNKGVPHSEATKIKMKEAWRKRREITQ